VWLVAQFWHLEAKKAAEGVGERAEKGCLGWIIERFSRKVKKVFDFFESVCYFWYNYI
jgi:hypothetical protein